MFAGSAFPPCPAILTRLLRETRADEPDFQRVGQLIGGDVGLAAEQIYCNATDEACHEWDLAGEWALAILDLTPEKLTRILSRIKGSMGRL